MFRRNQFKLYLDITYWKRGNTIMSLQGELKLCSDCKYEWAKWWHPVANMWSHIFDLFDFNRDGVYIPTYSPISTYYWVKPLK